MGEFITSILLPTVGKVIIKKATESFLDKKENIITYVKANLSSNEVFARSLGWRGGVTASASTSNRLNNALYMAGDSFVAKGDLNYIRPYLSSFVGSPNMSTVSVCVHSLDGSSYIGANTSVCCYDANGDTTPLIASSTTNDLGSVFFFNDCDLNVGSKYVYVLKNASATPTTQYFSYSRYNYSNSPNFSSLLIVKYPP